VRIAEDYALIADRTSMRRSVDVSRRTAKLLLRFCGISKLEREMIKTE
jgi:hypothetical protein